MQKNESFWWKSLYKSLFLLITPYEELISQLPSHFDILDEFEGELDNAINEDSLLFYVDRKWLTQTQVEELYTFYEFIQKIQPKPWTLSDFNSGEDWLIAKKWAKKIFDDIGFENTGYDSFEEIIFIK